MLTPGYQDQGLGPEALRLAIRWLIDEHGHHRFTIDPAVENVRAIVAYERVGFKPVASSTSTSAHPKATGATAYSWTTWPGNC